MISRSIQVSNEPVAPWDGNSSSCSVGGDSSSYDLSIGRYDRNFIQPPIFKLVKTSRWEKLGRILKRKRNHHRYHIRDEAGMTILGVALSYGAPLEIIQLIIDAAPEQLTDIDLVRGANSLHVACLNGMPNSLVSFLVGRCSDLAFSRDKDHRTPLHYATECICLNPRRIDLKEGMKVIDTLCRYNCALIHATDLQNQSPMDIVHIARCHVDLCDEERRRDLSRLSRFLRKISKKVYKAQKKLWEDNKTLNVENAIEALSAAFTFSTTGSSAFVQSFTPFFDVVEEGGTVLIGYFSD